MQTQFERQKVKLFNSQMLLKVTNPGRLLFPVFCSVGRIVRTSGRALSHFVTNNSKYKKCHIPEANGYVKDQ